MLLRKKTDYTRLLRNNFLFFSTNFGLTANDITLPGGGAPRTGADFTFLDGVDLAALLWVGWVRVLRRWTDGLEGTWGALAASKRLRLKDGLPPALWGRCVWVWFTPGLELRDESDELRIVDEEVGGFVAVVGFLVRLGVALGRRLVGSFVGVRSLIRHLDRFYYFFFISLKTKLTFVTVKQPIRVQSTLCRT